MSHSLGTRVALIISGVLLGLMLLAGLWLDRELTRNIQQDEILHAQDQARALLTSFKTLMLNGNGNLARQWLDNLRGSNGIAEVAMVRRDGTLAFYDDSTLAKVNRYLEADRFHRRPALPPLGQLVGVSSQTLRDALRTEQIKLDVRGLESVAVVMPIPYEKECALCHGYERAGIRGVFVMTVARDVTRKRIAAMRNQLWLIAGGLSTVLGLLLWLFMRRNVLRPISELRRALQRAAQGDRAAAVAVGRKDELGEVADAFNHMQRLLEASERRIRAVIDNVSDGIAIADRAMVIEAVNPAVSRIFGYYSTELIGQSVLRLLSEDTRSTPNEVSFRDLVTDPSFTLHGISREELGHRKNGAVFPMEVTISEMEVGDAEYFILNLRDITWRAEQTASLRHQALHDALTGLPNRILLFDRVNQAISASKREQRPFALMLFDLNRFKPINDTLGHHVGDLVLKHVGDEVRRVLRRTDTIARIGGDEFAVLLPGTDLEAATQMTEKVLGALAVPVSIEGNELQVGGSIGLAMYPPHGDELEVLLRHADAAMYEAKRNKLGFVVYDARLDQVHAKEDSLARGLADALERDAVEVMLQPQRAGASGQVIGFELTPCWRYSDDHQLWGDDLLGFALKHDMALRLCDWLLTRVVTVLAIPDCRRFNLQLSVNVGAGALKHQGFLHLIGGYLRGHSELASCLAVEVTESDYMEDPFIIGSVMQKLQHQGVRISLDHYGVGGTPLMNLLQMPVDDIKIDESYIQAVTVNSQTRLAVRAIVEFSHILGLRVGAGGVNSKELDDCMREYRVDVVQGASVGQDIEFREFDDWCRRNLH